MEAKLLILVLANAILLPELKGQLLPVPENVSVCVIHKGNNVSLNVQWNIGNNRFGLSTSFYTIHYFSNESDVAALNSSTVQPNAQFTNISGISIPNSFNGQQIQVQVSLTFNGQESSRSLPTTVDIRPVYLASFDISTGNITVLNMEFNLACDIESGATCTVEIMPLNNNTNANMSQRQIHNITDNNGKNLFRSQQAILTFLNITQGLDYTVQAYLLSSEGRMIGSEFQTLISIPFDTTPELTSVTTNGITTTEITIITTVTTMITMMSSSELSQSVSQDIIQGTSTDHTQLIETSTMKSVVSKTPIARDNLESESDNSSSIGIAIGVSVGCLLLLVLAITLCIIIISMKRNDKRKKKTSKESRDCSLSEESFNRYTCSCSSTTVLHNASATQIDNVYERRILQKHEYNLPPDTNYILYEEAPQIANSQSNNHIPSHYETAENQNIQILPFLSNGHYEMSDEQNPENVNQTDYSELVHNSKQSSIDIPSIPSLTYDYDQLDQPAKNEKTNTGEQHYYDSLTNMENASYQNMQESNGYTELQESTFDQSRPYQSLTSSNNTQSPKFHQYEEVQNDKATIAVEGNYSEPYNLKNKKLLYHQYDVVTGDVNPLPKRPFVKEYSEPRDTLNIFLN